MSPLQSLWDTIAAARFELTRAVRTWQALALLLLYLVASTGFVLMFVFVLWLVENELANTLGVPATDYPGAMTQQLIDSGKLNRPLGQMVGDEQLVSDLLEYPMLALFYLFVGLRVTPFLAAMTSAESISTDMRSRALRFELLRTGRLELVTGRFLGQAALAWVASMGAGVGAWVVGMTLMVGNNPFELAVALMWFSVRIWVFSIPFVGLGITCSQVTRSPAWARVMAIIGTAVFWVLFLVIDEYRMWKVPWLWDAVLQIMPWTWREGLWHPGWGWLIPTLVLAAMGYAMVAVGYLFFSRKDL